MKKTIYCDHCKKETEFFIDYSIESRIIKGEKIRLKIPQPKCLNCNAVINTKYYDSLVKKMFSDEYRNIKNIIAIDDIISIRKGLHLSQRDFSRLLGFGEITISRYETGLLPSKKHSNLIESIRDHSILMQYYELNKDELSAKAVETLEGILKIQKNVLGNKAFDKSKFNELSAYFIFKSARDHQSMYLTRLNELLFYSDFNHFRKFGKSITGSKYNKYSFGPVPNEYDYKYDLNPYIKTEIIDEKRIFTLTTTPAFNSLLDSEKLIADIIYNKFKDDYGSTIIEATTREKAVVETKLGDFISYDYALEINVMV